MNLQFRSTLAPPASLIKQVGWAGLLSWVVQGKRSGVELHRSSVRLVSAPYPPDPFLGVSHTGDGWARVKVYSDGLRGPELYLDTCLKPWTAK